MQVLTAVIIAVANTSSANIRVATGSLSMDWALWGKKKKKKTESVSKRLCWKLNFRFCLAAAGGS